jgi:dephospho-CoA kinase
MGSAKIIGLTGNIASGKSTVAGLLSALGIAVVDADQIAREAVKPGTKALEKITKNFGDDLLLSNGELNRTKLRERVFKDDAARRKLESLLHPAIQKLSELEFERLKKQGAKLIIYEASLLIEAGRYKDFDGILVVICPKEIQLQRLRERDHSLSEKTAEQILSAQMPAEQKAAHADWTITNDGTIDQLRTKVQNWLKEVLGKHPNPS